MSNRRESNNKRAITKFPKQIGYNETALPFGSVHCHLNERNRDFASLEEHEDEIPNPYNNLFSYVISHGKSIKERNCKINRTYSIIRVL